MVKLAKKKVKGFKKARIDPQSLNLVKSGIINIPQTYDLQGRHLGKEAYLLVVALYALSDPGGSVILHEEEMRLAASLADSLINETGDLDIDNFKEGFSFYDGLLHTLFNAKKIEHRKNKKFGEPTFPTLEEMWDTLEEIKNKGLIDDQGRPTSTKYDLAVMRQQLTRDGYDVEKLIHRKC